MHYVATVINMVWVQLPEMMIISGVFLVIDISDWQESSAVSSVICDDWWHLKLVAFKCHQGLGLWSSQGPHCMANEWWPCTGRICPHSSRMLGKLGWLSMCRRGQEVSVGFPSPAGLAMVWCGAPLCTTTSPGCNASQTVQGGHTE